VQLARLEAFTRIRNEQASQYREAFANLTRFEPLPRFEVEGGRHAYHFFTVRVSEMTRDAALRGLRRLGIGAAIHYEPIHLHPYYRRRLGLVPGSFPVAEEAGATTLTLPIGPALQPIDVERVISAVQKLDRLPLSRPPRIRRGAAAARHPSRGPSPPRPTTGAAVSPDAPS
jgi:perosamine synthetase